MIYERDRERMEEYVASKLEESGNEIIAEKKKIVPGIYSRYIKVNGDGIVLLVDKKYGAENFRRLYGIARKQFGQHVGVVFFKDGDTFFRSAAPKVDFKRRHDLSLKEYDTEEVRRMISLRPEELHVEGGASELQYYQPDSERLDEGIVTYTFKPVTYDYSHLPGMNEFARGPRDSARLRMWSDSRFTQKPLNLEGDVLNS